MMPGGGGGAAGAGGGGKRRNENRGSIAPMMMPLPLQVHAEAVSGVGDDDEFPRRDERIPQWGSQETRDFIAIRAELERDFSVAKRKNRWEVVSARMTELGHRRNARQCKCKWKYLVTRYKAVDASDPDYRQQFPFFEEMKAVFSHREETMKTLLGEAEAGSTQAKKKLKRMIGDQSSEEFSDYEEDDDEESDVQRATRPSNPRKRKEKERRLQTAAVGQSSRQPNTGNDNNSGNNIAFLQEMLHDFFQQQLKVDMMWRESLERHAFERQRIEQEWREKWEKLERERMMAEQQWREREEQRRVREEGRAERRDALLALLLEKLLGDNP